MNKNQEERIERVLREIEAEAYSGERFLPIVGPEKGRFYYLVTKLGCAKRVLELGTLVGYSALLFSKALGGKGEIVTVEYDKALFDEAEANFKKAGVKNVEAVHGDARKVLKRLVNAGEKFDVVLLDIWKEEYVQVFDDCVRLLRGRGMILSDNALWDTHEMIAFRSMLKKHRKVESVIVPIGDGIAMSVKS